MLQKAKEELQQQLSSCGAEDADSALVIGTQLAAAIFRRCGAVILMFHNVARVSHYASQFGSCVIAVPKNCVSAVLSALAQPRDASATPPSPAYEEATAALKVQHCPPPVPLPTSSSTASCAFTYFSLLPSSGA